MGRRLNWEKYLDQHIEEWRNKSFEWGKYDCALFCLYAEKAICGSSRFDDFIGQYKSAAGSVKALIKFGGGNLADTVAQRLEECDILTARRGDVALINTPEGDALSVVIGEKVAAMGHNGLIFLPIDAAKKCWRV